MHYNQLTRQSRHKPRHLIYNHIFFFIKTLFLYKLEKLCTSHGCSEHLVVSCVTKVINHWNNHPEEEERGRTLTCIMLEC